MRKKTKKNVLPDSYLARVRDSGLKVVGQVPWGTHFCQFYQTQNDLTDILVPYFKAGLLNNEFCVWVTSDFLTREEALKALEKEIPNFSKYLKRAQIEIFPYTDWYIENGKFDLERVLGMWLAKHNASLKSGFEGLRVSGNPFWIDNKKDWDDFAEYEAEINNVIDPYNLLVLCTYSMSKCKANEIVDVVTNHKFALIKRAGSWELIESTEQKKAINALKKTEAKYQELFENMINGFAYHEIILDQEGRPIDYRFLEVNNAFENLTGLKKENLLGKTARKVLPGIEKDPSDWIGKYGKVALTGKPVRFESFSAQLNRWYGVFAYSPKKGSFASIFEDITERKAMEDNQRNFFAIVGHELKNILTPTLLSTALLEKKDIKDEKIKRALKIINRQTENMSSLVEDLLEVSKLERGKIRLNKKRVRISKIIEKAIENVKPLIDGSKQKIKFSKVSVENRVLVDPLRMEQVLTNLLVNASKYSKEKGLISINFEEGEKEITIEIKDRGIGVSKELLPKIFDLFMRLDNNRGKEGLGIGLYLSRELARIHGGDIFAKSKGRGKGAQFFIKIPYKPLR